MIVFQAANGGEKEDIVSNESEPVCSCDRDVQTPELPGSPTVAAITLSSINSCLAAETYPAEIPEQENEPSEGEENNKEYDSNNVGHRTVNSEVNLEEQLVDKDSMTADVGEGIHNEESYTEVATQLNLYMESKGEGGDSDTVVITEEESKKAESDTQRESIEILKDVNYLYTKSEHELIDDNGDSNQLESSPTVNGFSESVEGSNLSVEIESSDVVVHSDVNKLLDREVVDSDTSEAYLTPTERENDPVLIPANMSDKLPESVQTQETVSDSFSDVKPELPDFSESCSTITKEQISDNPHKSIDSQNPSIVESKVEEVLKDVVTEVEDELPEVNEVVQDITKDIPNSENDFTQVPSTPTLPFPGSPKRVVEPESLNIDQVEKEYPDTKESSGNVLHGFLTAQAIEKKG